MKVMKYLVVDGESELEKRIEKEIDEHEITPTGSEWCGDDVCGEIYSICDFSRELRGAIKKEAGEVDYIYIPVNMSMLY